LSTKLARVNVVRERAGRSPRLFASVEQIARTATAAKGIVDDLKVLHEVVSPLVEWLESTLTGASVIVHRLVSTEGSLNARRGGVLKQASQTSLFAAETDHGAVHKPF
jgi:hypothetical protein